MHECVFGWRIRMAHCGDATGPAFETGFFHMVVVLLSWVWAMLLCSGFCIVTTMPAFRGRLGLSKKALCALCSWLALMSIFSNCAHGGDVVVKPTGACYSSTFPTVVGVATLHMPIYHWCNTDRSGSSTGGMMFVIIGTGCMQTWLILPAVICLSQRLSHACLSISFNMARL